MTENDDLRKATDERERVLAAWLERWRRLHSVAPIINQIHRHTLMEQGIARSMPEELWRKIPSETVGRYRGETAFIQRSLPALPEPSEFSLTPSSTSISVTLLAHLVTEEDDTTPQIATWARTTVHVLDSIQKEMGLLDELRTHLLALDTTLIDELDVVEASSRDPVTGPGKTAAAAIAMRNLLEHWKGRLWQKARSPAEQKFDWAVMTSRLAKAVPGTYDHQLILEQERTHDNLHDRLSRLAKNVDSTTEEGLLSLRLEVITHMHAVGTRLDTAGPKRQTPAPPSGSR